MPNLLELDPKHELPGIPAPASLLSNSDELVAGIRVTRAQFAKMMGCSRQAVTEWVRAGRLTVGPDGRFDPRAAVASLLRTGDPARLRAKVLQPLAAELQTLRGRIVHLEAALGQALRTIETERTERERMIDEAIEFHEGAAAELLEIFEALREQIATAWQALADLPENAGAGIVIGWLDSALQVGPERAGPIVVAREEEGERGGRVTDIIHETLLKVKEAVSSGRQINDETLLKIEEEIKREHNGYRYTVSKRPSHRALRELCAQDLDAGHTYKEVAKRHGISERTVYRRAKESGDE